MSKRPENIWIGKEVKEKLEDFCRRNFGILYDKVYGEVGRLAILFAIEHEKEFMDWLKNMKERDEKK